MRTVDAIVEVLKREGVPFLSCYPTTPVIDAAAAAWLRPIVCRQERVGVGIADGFTRVSNGKRTGVFAMQYGPGSENAFPGVATAYSDSTPILVLPLGHPTSYGRVPPLFSALEGYRAVTKWVERLDAPEQVGEALRRAFSRLRLGRPGPVMVEVPADVAMAEAPEGILASYQPARATRSAGDPQDVQRAAAALIQARSPVILAGHGVLYAEATPELVEVAELLQAPVMTTLLAKSAFPEDHPLSLGVAATVVTGHGVHFFRKADTVLAVGASLTRHSMSISIPPGKTIVHVTNDERDINKHFPTDYPVLGDAKLALRQLAEALRERLRPKARGDGAVTAEVQAVRQAWLKEWTPLLTSRQAPINPYRVVWEMQQAIPPQQALVTHDAGSPRDQLLPFYQAPAPRRYLGWGKSHALGTGLGLIMGAKLAAPEAVCINVMGDAAFGMVGLDFETAVRHQIPIITVVLNNATMAIEERNLIVSHERYRTRDIGGSYADIARALGGYAERVEDPEQVGAAFLRARRVTEEEKRPALLEFITSAETRFSYRRVF